MKMIQVRKEKTVAIRGYLVTGYAHVTDWYCNDGSIAMTPKLIDDPNDLEKVKGAINDGGFGVRDMLGATVTILELDENMGKEVVLDKELIVFDEKDRKLCKKLHKRAVTWAD